jgi:hypothetical protein
MTIYHCGLPDTVRQDGSRSNLWLVRVDCVPLDAFGTPLSAE